LACSYLWSDGETWKKSACRIATCKDGKVTISAVLCPIPEPIMCANNLPPVKVYTKDGCCFHYECQCLCYGWGDPHYLTFDGTYYSFQGSCSYWLVKEVFPRYGFSVMVSNGKCTESYSTCIQSITVFYNQYKIYMRQHANNIFTNVVLVNDKTVSHAFQNAEIRITTTGITSVLLIPKIKAKITFSARTYSILLPFSLFGSHTQGQCGKCNNNRGDDCIVPGTRTEHCQQMAHEWHTKDDYCHPPPDPSLLPTLPHWDTTICDIMKSSVFEDCHGVVGFQSFYTACVHDVRSSRKASEGCLSLQMYALSCSQAGVCVDWRSATGGICGTHSLHHYCQRIAVIHVCQPTVLFTSLRFMYLSERSSCVATIHIIIRDRLIPIQLEGCYCPSGTTLLSAYSSECVPTCGEIRTPKHLTLMCKEQFPCEKCVCSMRKDPVTFLHLLDCEPIPCDTNCAPGYVYQLRPGECCGKCVQTHCVVNLPFITHILQPEEVWSPPGDPCVTYRCVRTGSQFLTVEARTKCPPFDPRDCIPVTASLLI
uniref:VWFD domain-containing protein n=1 Tax=Neogobius melanostomus TaxID=47308 RepID=A0A8C6SHT4_9GOBI